METPQPSNELELLRSELNSMRRELTILKAQKSRRRLFKTARHQTEDLDKLKRCSDAVRKIYKELARNEEEEQENQLPRFDFTTNYSSVINKTVESTVLKEVRSLYGKDKWSKAEIKGALEQYWTSLRDDSVRKAKNTFIKHRKSSKRMIRLRRKLAKRLESLERAALSEKDKERIHGILTSEDAIHYMSSEESDQEADYSGNGPKPRRSIPLAWERTRLRNIKKELDNSYSSTRTPSQKRTSATVERHDFKISPRVPPVKFSPTWAVRTPH